MAGVVGTRPPVPIIDLLTSFDARIQRRQDVVGDKDTLSSNAPCDIRILGQDVLFVLTHQRQPSGYHFSVLFALAVQFVVVRIDDWWHREEEIEEGPGRRGKEEMGQGEGGKRFDEGVVVGIADEM